jgi:PAS domain S-box-containing protein
MLALASDGRVQRGLRYDVAPTPCRTVLGQQFRAYPRELAALFPEDPDVLHKGAQSYAGHPLIGLGGEPLGVVAVGSRRPLEHLAHIESVLKLFALRAAAEVERLQGLEALRRSEASYRTIFDSAESAIFVHDWETFALVDVNRRACEEHGRTREELLATPPAELVAGEAPYDVEHAVAHLQQARLGRSPPFEWHVRVTGGALRWWEIHLKPAQLDGRPCVLAFTHDITERKAAEAQLREREEQYRAIFDGSVDPMVLWNRRLEVADVNDAFVRVTGLAREQVIGRHWTARPDVEDLRKLVPHIEAALGGRAAHVVERVEHAGEGLIDMELRYLPVRIDGEPFALGIARDITERIAAEARLRASEEQYRAIFNASEDAMVLWDEQFRRVDVNAAHGRLYGFAREEVIGRGYEHLPYPPEYAAARLDLVRRAFAGETCRAEVQALKRDGGFVLTEMQAIPFQHRGARHVLTTARDITERKRAEAALREREEQYRIVFDGSADAMMLWDADLRVVDVNEVYLRWTGFTRRDVFELKHLQQLDADDIARRATLVRGALAGREGQIESVVRRSDGSEFDIELRYVPMRFAGKPMALAIGRDISARRAAEAERQQLEIQLRQAQKMEAIGQLTGGIAHDFNNILTSVLGYVAMAEERAGKLGDARLVHQLGQAQRGAERARDLIAQMLAFARRKPAARRPLQPLPLVRQAIELLRPTVPSSVMLELEVGEATAAGAANDGAVVPAVEADAVQLEQVVMNLAINARDAIDGAGRIGVAVRESRGGWRCASCGLLTRPGRWVEIAVADNGSGIAEATLARMFDPFFSTKPAGRGSGMGLAMVHGIVHEHGGHIGVLTNLGAGTTFRILLPAASAAPAVAPAPAPAPNAAATPASAVVLRGHVLVVEDDALAGEFLVEQLTDWGLATTLQRDPREASAWLQDPAHHTDVLLTDLTMPHLTGVQLAALATRARPGLPVILVSGDLGQVETAQLTAAGVRYTLGKPVLPGVLREFLVQLLRAAPQS